MPFSFYIFHTSYALTGKYHGGDGFRLTRYSKVIFILPNGHLRVGPVPAQAFQRTGFF